MEEINEEHKRILDIILQYNKEQDEVKKFNDFLTILNSNNAILSYMAISICKFNDKQIDALCKVIIKHRNIGMAELASLFVSNEGLMMYIEGQQNWYLTDVQWNI